MPQKPKKTKLSVTIDTALIEYIDSQITTKRFSSRSHALEYAISELKNKDRK